MGRMWHFLHKIMNEGCGRQFPQQVLINGLLYNFKCSSHNKGYGAYTYEHDRAECVFVISDELWGKLRIKADKIQIRKGKIHPLDYILRYTLLGKE